MRLLPAGWIVFAALGQELPQAKIGALMEPSLERQRAAVRTQSASPVGNFFALSAFFLPPPPTLGAANLMVADAGCAAVGDAELRPLAAEAAQAAGLKPEWLLALVAEKSQARPCAVSPAGAVGLMQLAPATVDQLHLEDPFDPRQNLAAGARLLAPLITRYHGDFEQARAAYDGTAGPSPQTSGTVPVPAAPAAFGHSENQPFLADKKQ
jgi:soluble lytic murein transglycosylase-like protein